MLKPSTWGLLFFAVFVPFYVILCLRINSVNSALNAKIQYENIMDNAVDDAFISAVEGIDSKGNVIINKDQIKDNFLNSLYNGFNSITGNTEVQQISITSRIPIMILVDNNGYYVCSMEEYRDSTNAALAKHVWKSKKYYTYKHNNYIYNFTLSDFVTIYDMQTKETYEGYYQDLIDNYGLTDGGVLDNYETFDSVRRHTIIEMLIKDISYYINVHNLYAKQYGVNYYFTLPEMDMDTWYRTIDDISFLAFIQGFPIQSGITGNYYLNNFSFSCARLIKSDIYYIQEDATTHIKYYHKGDCSKLLEKSLIADSMESAAAQGYFPCPDCID